jgi:5-methylcytosine-specific restriction protein A
MPEANSIWFIFVSNNELCIGAMPEEKWRSLGREDNDDDEYIANIYNEPKQPQQTQAAGGLIWKRDPQLAIARFKLANYRCEFDPGHKLFISRSTGQPFLEAHHLLPMKYQHGFKDSLDIKDNIVALCPFCHRLIHHATVKETRPLLDNLIASRQSLVQKFKINQIVLYRFYNCEEILAN